MRYYDSHLHLPSPDNKGVDSFLSFLDKEKKLLGGNLILNTDAEILIVESNINRFPSNIVFVPYYNSKLIYSTNLMKHGWLKIHPYIQRLTEKDIQEIASSLRDFNPIGVIIHCYPWGTDLQFNISLQLTIELALAMPNAIILAAHGGGYESWLYRAHTGSLKNVHYDFSFTLEYYEGSDLLLPIQRYLKYSKNRIHFGSDWPYGNINNQYKEMIRHAKSVGIDEEELEALLLNNYQLCWSNLGNNNSY